MVRHLYTLNKLSQELQSLIGCKIIDCFTQERDTLMIKLFDGADTSFLYFSARPNNCCLYRRQIFNRANRNSVNLFNILSGQTIKSIVADSNDRIMTIQTNSYQIVFNLFGGSRSNLFVVDADNLICDAFKTKSKFAGSMFKQDITMKANAQQTDLFDLLSKDYPYLGKYYAHEFLRDATINLNDSNELIRKAEEFRNRILQNDLCYLLFNGSEYLFSLIELDGWEVAESFTSISEGIEKRLRKEFTGNALNKSKIKVIARLNSASNRVLKTINEIENDEKNTERIRKYRDCAELLMTYPNQKEKSLDMIQISNSSGEVIAIKLDPAKSINENATAYFKKAKNSEMKIKIRKEMLTSLYAKKDKIDKLIELTTQGDTLRKIEKIKNDNPEFFSEYSAEESGSRFRVFELGEGYTLYVGKNAANNDELTVKFAKPHDLWFHARGSSGSHAVLRLNKDEKPPKHILKMAASVAAYYSGAKNAKYVPVCYALKKYVSKPRGANPGSVTLSREDVIMVEPRLPDMSNTNK